MLTAEQAQTVVLKGIAEAGGNVGAPTGMTLASAGLDPPKIDTLVSAIVNIGLSQFDHGIDYTAIVKFLLPGTTIGDLSGAVFELAVGKVCSGPAHHPQPYPAPSICGQCPYPVP
jgi:hypothetical protein